MANFFNSKLIVKINWGSTINNRDKILFTVRSFWFLFFFVVNTFKNLGILLCSVMHMHELLTQYIRYLVTFMRELSSVYVLRESMMHDHDYNNQIYFRSWRLKEQLVLKVKSSESETHDVVEGFELYEASIGIPRNSIGWINWFWVIFNIKF